MDRRGALASGLSLVVLGLGRGARAAEEPEVPVALQMELLLKVAGHDRALPARAGNVARVLLVAKPDEPESRHVAEQAARALAGKRVKSLPVEVTSVTYRDGPALSERVRLGRIAILYLAPGFGTRELLTVARSLAGLSLLSAGALAHFYETGVALSFDLVGGKPKLLVNLRRAREQGVDLSSQVLKLAKVIA